MERSSKSFSEPPPEPPSSSSSESSLEQPSTSSSELSLEQSSDSSSEPPPEEPSTSFSEPPPEQPSNSSTEPPPEQPSSSFSEPPPEQPSGSSSKPRPEESSTSFSEPPPEQPLNSSAEPPPEQPSSSFSEPPPEQPSGSSSKPRPEESSTSFSEPPPEQPSSSSSPTKLPQIDGILKKLAEWNTPLPNLKFDVLFNFKQRPNLPSILQIRIDVLEKPLLVKTEVFLMDKIVQNWIEHVLIDTYQTPWIDLDFPTELPEDGRIAMAVRCEFFQTSHLVYDKKVDVGDHSKAIAMIYKVPPLTGAAAFILKLNDDGELKVKREFVQLQNLVPGNQVYKAGIKVDILRTIA